MIYHLSCLWNDRKIKSFLNKILLQSLIVFLITIVCMLGAYILGIPVLSFLYNTDLQPYKTELMILLIGGGFLGLSGVFTAVITIMRYQRVLAVGYIVVSLIAFFMSDLIVSEYGIMGATVLYTGLMILLCLGFTIIMFVGIKREKQEE